MDSQKKKAAPAGTGLDVQLGGQDIVRAGLARAQGGTAVIENGKLAGFLIDRRDGVEAVSATGHRFGLYNNMIAAAWAILSAVMK